MSTNVSKMGSDSECGAQSEEQMGEEAKRRGPKGQLPEDWFERVRRRVAEGEPVTCAIQAEGMGFSWFYERVGEKPELWESLQKARQVKMEDVLENELCRLVFAGEGKPVYWKGYQVGEERHYSDGLLMFLLQRLLPEKYGNTRASAKRQTELKRKEQVFKKLLVDAQVALDEERRNRTEILTSVGVPVPPRRYAGEAVGGTPVAGEPVGGTPVDSAPVGGATVEGEQRTGKATPCTLSAFGGEGGEQRSEDRDQKAGKATPCTPLAFGGGDAETGRRGDTERLATGAPAGNEMAETLWAPGRMMTTTMFEDEAYRRVVEGVPRPIYKQGVQIGERRVKSERLLKFMLVANVPEKYGKRDLPPIRPEEEPGRKEYTEKHNALVREDAELNRAFEDWVLCNSANRNHRVPPCTQGRECSICGCGGKGLLCHTLPGKASAGENVESRKLKAEIGIESGGEGGEGGEQRSEDREQRSGKVSPCTLSAFGGKEEEQRADPPSSEDYGGQGARDEEMQVAIKIKSKIMIKNGIGFEGGEESESQGTESRDQRSDGGDQPPSSEDDGGLGAGTASPCTPLENTELPESGMRTEGHADRSEGLTGEEHAPGEQQAEIVAGKEAPQPPAGNTEIARAAGKAPKEEALPGDEIPQSEKVPWRYDPYEVSRKIREAEKARRMRRRQIDV